MLTVDIVESQVGSRLAGLSPLPAFHSIDWKYTRQVNFLRGRLTPATPQGGEDDEEEGSIGHGLPSVETEATSKSATAETRARPKRGSLKFLRWRCAAYIVSCAVLCRGSFSKLGELEAGRENGMAFLCLYTFDLIIM